MYILQIWVPPFHILPCMTISHARSQKKYFEKAEPNDNKEPKGKKDKKEKAVDKSDKEKSTDKTEGGGKSKKSKGKHADDDGQEDAAPSKRRRRDASKGQ